MTTPAPLGSGTGAEEMPGGQFHGTESQRPVPAELAPECAYVGAVLRLDLRTARAALARVDDTDLGDHRLRVVLAVARRLAAEGIAPDPVAVLARARADGDVRGAPAISDLSLLILDLVDAVPIPASWGYYAQAILDDTLRRRCVEMGLRMIQAADGESTESLIELEAREDAAVRELAARRTTTPTPLRAVP